MMRMMRFTKIAEDIQAALTQFCILQNDGYICDEEIESIVESAFTVFGRFRDTSLPAAPVFRYQMYAGVQYTDEILPESIKENGILYDRCIHLGTFSLDSYGDTADNTKIVVRGYDVFYDMESGLVKLVYRIMAENNSMTALYRVDTDYYEDFDVYEFIIDIAAQVINKLKLSLSIPQ